jgi:hypothetical protein
MSAHSREYRCHPSVCRHATDGGLADYARLKRFKGVGHLLSLLGTQRPAYAIFWVSAVELLLLKHALGLIACAMCRIFVEDVDDPSAPVVDASSDDAPPYAGLPKTPRPLQNENFMGDVVTLKVRQNQPFKFVFKRKIFLKNLDGPSEDAMFERLTFLQVRSLILSR